MLFSVLAVAQAAIVLGWPCQRLNWAWRNVWTTCGIQAYVPNTATAGTIPGGFAQVATIPSPTASSVGFQLDANGVFAPASTNAPQMCTTGAAAGGSLMRNRCRRMLDTYGNLVFLCATPSKALPPNYVYTPVTPAPNNYINNLGTAQPGAALGPHAANAASLSFMAQACLTPGTSFPTTVNTCPGLMGWFTVVWNACSFTAAPGFGTPFTPYYTPLQSPSVGLAFYTPINICGATPGAAPSTTVWNFKGPSFRSTKCRRAMDQFGRTAAKCGTTPSTTGFYDVLRGLASPAQLGGIAPTCGQ